MRTPTRLQEGGSAPGGGGVPLHTPLPAGLTAPTALLAVDVKCFPKGFDSGPDSSMHQWHFPAAKLGGKINTL